MTFWVYGTRDVSVAWGPARPFASSFKPLLHPQEIQEWAAIRNPKRAAEWLAARWALKCLAWKMLAVRHARFCWTTKNHFGVPRLHVVQDGWERIYPCSMSHSGGLGAAALRAARAGAVGLDVQKVTPNLVCLQRAFVHARDRLGVGLDPLWRCSALWACKEAAAKALGLGMAVDFVSLRVQGKGAGRFTVRRFTGLESMEGLFFIIPPVWVCSVVWLPVGPGDSM